MKYRNPVSGYFVALLLAGMAVSCSQDQVLEPVQTTPDAAGLHIKAVSDGAYHGEIVPLELAQVVAQKAEFQQLFGGLDSLRTNGRARVANGTKTIRSAISLRDKHNQPALHVINYQNGGYVVLSAERSVLPVLAFSDNGAFDAGKPNDVVKEWLSGTSAQIERLRLQPAAARQSATTPGMQWDNVLAMTGQTSRNGKIAGPKDPLDPDPTPSPTPCNSFWLAGQAGPYVVTRWDQAYGYDWFGAHYNYYCPAAAGGPDGKALAGCGAVAGAQLVRYFQFPNGYGYNTMPNSNANLETARLIRDVGVQSKSVYGAGETSTTTANLAQTFRDWGYKYVSHYDSYTTTDLSMALAHQPVILRGKPAVGSGHIWVCDGYKKIQSNCPTPQTYYWHMNWGWGGSSDGYFSDWGGKLNETTNRGEGSHNVFGAGRRMIKVRPW